MTQFCDRLARVQNTGWKELVVQGAIIRPDGTGHTTLTTWDTDSPVSLHEAQKAFDRLQAEGNLLYGKTAEGNVHMRKFDPSVEEIVVSKQPVGG